MTMSLRSLGPDLERIWEQLMQQIEEAIEQHGLDPGATGVLTAIRDEFGEDVVKSFEEWTS